MPTKLEKERAPGGDSSRPERERSPTSDALNMDAVKGPSAYVSNASGTGLSEKNTSLKSWREGTDAIHYEESTAPLLSLDEEKLASLSLVNDVVERLHLQMRRLTLKHDAGSIMQDPIGASHSERQRVGLAIKTAAEIRNMIRLKLDAVKVFRDLK